VQKHSFPTVRYFNGILFVFTLVFLKCAHYSTDFGTQMFDISNILLLISKKQSSVANTSCKLNDLNGEQIQPLRK